MLWSENWKNWIGPVNALDNSSGFWEAPAKRWTFHACQGRSQYLHKILRWNLLYLEKSQTREAFVASARLLRPILKYFCALVFCMLSLDPNWSHFCIQWCCLIKMMKPGSKFCFGESRVSAFNCSKEGRVKLSVWIMRSALFINSDEDQVYYRIFHE